MKRSPDERHAQTHKCLDQKRNICDRWNISIKFLCDFSLEILSFFGENFPIFCGICNGLLIKMITKLTRQVAIKHKCYSLKHYVEQQDGQFSQIIFCIFSQWVVICVSFKPWKWEMFPVELFWMFCGSYAVWATDMCRRDWTLPEQRAGTPQQPGIQVKTCRLLLLLKKKKKSIEINEICSWDICSKYKRKTWKGKLISNILKWREESDSCL